MNGALTIGTLDGANIEIKNEVGEDNIFIFGLKAEEVEQKRREGYNPHFYYDRNPGLKQVLEMIRDGYFSPENPHLFDPIIDSLLNHGDHYMVLADFEDYVRAQEDVDSLYRNPQEWTRKSIINSANMGHFSSDRAIQDYCDKIWKIQPLE